MKKPDGSLDIIGASINLASQIGGLISDFAPDKDECRARRLRRRINVAIRQLKHRFKDAAIEPYVNLNFSEQSEAVRKDIAMELQGLLGRK